MTKRWKRRKVRAAVAVELPEMGTGAGEPTWVRVQRAIGEEIDEQVMFSALGVACSLTGWARCVGAGRVKLV